MSGKRIILTLAATALITSAATGLAAGFPEKNVTLVIPYRAGGGFDVYGRATARSMEKYLPHKVNIVPKNVPGAGGRKGAAFLYRAKPDGYTIGMVNIPGFAVPKILGQKVGYDIDKLTWIGRISKDKYHLVVPAKSAARTLADLQKAKRTLRFINMSPGTTQYLSFKVATAVLGLKVQDISGYRTMNEVLVGLIRGDGDAGVTAVSTSGAYVESGDLRVLGMFDTETRYPGVPTAKQLGYPELAFLGFERLVAAPPGVPENRRAVLEAALLKGLRDPEMAAWSKKTKKPVHPLGGAGIAAGIAKQTNFYLKYKNLLGKKRKKKK